jgi:hypothetical protein
MATGVRLCELCVYFGNQGKVQLLFFQEAELPLPFCLVVIDAHPFHFISVPMARSIA